MLYAFFQFTYKLNIDTTCVSGYVCTANGEYYSQCIPGTATGTTTTSPSGTGTPTGTTTTSAASGTATLVSGYSFIRGVVSSYFL